ncbi:hypothetical protein PHYPSEUDO_013803 [Phytophthora pseudosyringae]|uniref:Uncharacterized protein n=1 Tax=Phytophthora pseudosyringae TaxID=221518 RepID=A0A8T1W360_9STRA|nr:hypothetical protein PHYPSEUDO_013803 [Phytophthora pseudosyringae]
MLGMSSVPGDGDAQMLLPLDLPDMCLAELIFQLAFRLRFVLTCSGGGRLGGSCRFDSKAFGVSGNDFHLTVRCHPFLGHLSFDLLAGGGQGLSLLLLDLVQ